MIDRRTKNAEIFRDTERRYTSDSTLIQAVQQSTKNQVFIAETDNIIVPSVYKNEKAKVVVSGNRSLEAAEVYAKQGKKVCVLNFASATNPGGGVVNGSSAQEECICRCTTLYPCLNTDEMWNAFYKPHRMASNPLYNNDCIYTSDVCVFKSDTNFPEVLAKDEWWNVNILTCAAPNLRERPSNTMNPYAGNQAAKIMPSELEKLLMACIKRIFEIAVANENEVIILGAFGCGAFSNPPEVVAKVFSAVMQDYLCYFDTIEYAVYHPEREVANYEAFYDVIERRNKWHTLNLEAKKGNKKEAQYRLNQILDKYNAGDVHLAETMTHAGRERNRLANIKMLDYLDEWLEGHQHDIERETYHQYKRYIDGRIREFFTPLDLTVKDLSGDEINEFYTYLRNAGLKGSTGQRYHGVLHKAFKDAVKRRIIPSNPVDQANRPRKEQFIAAYYNAEEVKQLLELVKDDEIYIPILLAAYYGLRRSEVIVLEWSVIDFTENTLTVRHNVHSAEEGIVAKDRLKTKSSYRTLTLDPFVRGELIRTARSRSR